MRISATGLQRGLGALDVGLITFNSVVGSAIFIAAAIVPKYVPDPTLILALWAIAGLLTLAGAVTYAELGAMFPEAGGQYLYLREAYGRLWAFLFGWTSFWIIQTGAIAFLAVAAAEVMLGLAVPGAANAQAVAFIVPLPGELAVHISPASSWPRR